MRPAVTRSRRLTAGIAALIVTGGCASTLAACSGSGSGNTASGSPASAASPAAGGSTGQAAGSGSGAGANAGCAALTDAKVQPLLVAKITKSSSSTIPNLEFSVDSGTSLQCTFATRESQQAITVTLATGKPGQDYFTNAKQGFSTPASVPGIGAEAVRDAGDDSTGITAEDNGLTCNVDTSGADQLPGVAALEQAAGDTSDIGDANYAVISAALGTLCNVVFGSGNTTPDFSGLTMSTVTTAPDDGGLPTDFTLPTDGTN